MGKLEELNKARAAFRKLIEKGTAKVDRSIGRYASDVPILHEGAGPLAGDIVNDLPLEAPHISSKELTVSTDSKEMAEKVRKLMAEKTVEGQPSATAKELAAIAKPEAEQRMFRSAEDVEPTIAMDALPSKIALAGGAAIGLQNPYHVAKKIYEAYNAKLEQGGDIAAEKILDLTTPQGMPGAPKFKKEMLPILGAGIAGVADPLNFVGGGEAKAASEIAQLARRAKTQKALEVIRSGKKATLGHAEKLAAESAEQIVPLTKP